MAFDMGPLDRLFGKRVSLQVRGPDGTTREVSVTEKWVAEQERLGKMSPQSEIVLVQVADPLRGCYQATWKIGQDIDADTAKRRADPSSGRLHAIVVYKEGKPETFLCDPATWAEAKQKLVADDSPEG